MTDKPEAADEGATNFLAVLDEHDPKAVIVNTQARASLFEHIEKVIAEHEPDLSTTKGRDEITALAFKIVKTRTAMVAAADELTEDWRKKTAAVTTEKKAVEAKLKELEASVRQPLADWKEAEAKRTAIIEATIAGLNKDAEVSIEATATDVEARIARVEAMTFDEAVFKGALQSAQESQIRTLNFLRPVLERLQKAEADAKRLAELEAEAETRRLADEARAEEEKRKADEVEATKRAAEEARIAAEREKKEAEAKRQRDEEEAKLAAERAEQARKDAEEAAKAAAEKAAADAKAEAEAAAAERAAEAKRAADAALAAEKQRAADAEAAAAAERKAREEEDARRAQAEAAERARREKAERDEEHRTKCKREAKLALMTIPGVTEAIARDIVVLILAEEVPRTTLDFAAEPRVSARQAFEEAREEAPDAEAAEHVAELPLA